MAKILLEFGADPNSMAYPRPRHRGFTALHWLANCTGSNAGLEQAKFLLEHEANPNLGASPLYVAVLKGKAEMVKLLLQYGADPSRQEKKKMIYELYGMKKVEKYFGAPWKDIVRRIQEGEDLEGGQRQKRI
jgi:ankyrin repeat protein